jgi:hypothetical protein
MQPPLPASAVPIYCDDSPQIVFNQSAGTRASQACSLLKCGGVIVGTPAFHPGVASSKISVTPIWGGA